MRLDFVCSNPDISVGSYRIWIHDVAEVMRSMNCDVEIVDSVKNVRKDSIVIFSKGDYSSRKHLESDRIAGAINISAEAKSNFDFVIVGSPEEKKSLESYYDKVFIINLIEKMYDNCDLKNHNDKNDMTIGFHGSFTHLTKLKYGFVEAFNELRNEGHEIRLSCLTNDNVSKNQISQMLGISEKYLDLHHWNFQTAKNVIQSFDVGIVPNITDLGQQHPHLRTQTSINDGLYQADYMLRFKNKSNPGRAFVFYQLGIPVIADLTPSNMPMLYDESCGMIATCSKTWKKSIAYFKSATCRNEIAKKAHQRFKQLYSLENDVKSMLSVIPSI
jgi:hypothetical protein